MESITYSNGTLWLEIGGISAGYLEFDQDTRIGMIEIYEPYRGKGYYKKLLMAAFTVAGKDCLLSNNRNSVSNGFWERWTGEELEYTDECYVNLDEGKLNFFKV